MKKLSTAAFALTAATGLALTGMNTTSATAQKPVQKPNMPSAAVQNTPLKIRTMKLTIDPKDLSVDGSGNVVIRDPALALEVQRIKINPGLAAAGNICCAGCGCGSVSPATNKVLPASQR